MSIGSCVAIEGIWYDYNWCYSSELVMCPQSSNLIILKLPYINCVSSFTLKLHYINLLIVFGLKTFTVKGFNKFLGSIFSQWLMIVVDFKILDRRVCAWNGCLKTNFCSVLFIYFFVWNLRYFIKGIKLLGWELRLLGFAFTCVAHCAWFDSTRLSLLMRVGTYVLFLSILVQ